MSMGQWRVHACVGVFSCRQCVRVPALRERLLHGRVAARIDAEDEARALGQAPARDGGRELPHARVGDRIVAEVEPLHVGQAALVEQRDEGRDEPVAQLVEVEEELGAELEPTPPGSWD